MSYCGCPWKRLEVFVFICFRPYLKPLILDIRCQIKPSEDTLKEQTVFRIKFSENIELCFIKKLLLPRCGNFSKGL